MKRLNLRCQSIQRFILLKFIIFFGLVIPSQANNLIIPKDISTECRLKLGWVEWQPYQYFDPNDQIKGLQFELLERIARKANCQFQLVNLFWHQVQSGLRDGTIDVSPDASITQGRKAFAYFSVPYRPELRALYVSVNAPDFIIEPNVEDLVNKGFRLGLNQDYHYGETIESLKGNEMYQKQFLFFDHPHDTYEALSKSTIDGFFDDPMAFSFTSRKLKYEGLFTRHPIILIRSDASLMFSKETVSESTVEKFNKAIQEVKNSNYYIRRWEW